MRHARQLTLSWTGAAALTLAMILSGCGASATTTRQGRAAPDSTATALARTVAAAATAAAAATPFATEATSPAMVESAGCPALDLGPVSVQYGTVDGLKISIPHRYTPLDYPSELLPNTARNAPYQVPLTATVAQQSILFHPDPPVNPSLATGYVLQVCNQTSAAHTLSSLGVRITSFTPSSGTVAVWHLCQDGPYDAATKQTTTGCGGAAGEVDWLAATLPNDSTGASAATTPNAQVHSGGPNPPFSIDPNKSIVLLVAVNGLTSQGTYALGFDIGIDGAAPTTLAPSDGSFLIAPSAKVWTGTACQTPAMQALIPPSSQDTYYVCPPAS